MNDLAEERRRILRAARDRRLQVNGAGRYVIDGEKKRPDRKVRESLMSGGFIYWHSMRITADGASELVELEKMA